MPTNNLAAQHRLNFSICRKRKACMPTIYILFTPDGHQNSPFRRIKGNISPARDIILVTEQEIIKSYYHDSIASIHEQKGNRPIC
jgi:hypothetical protein